MPLHRLSCLAIALSSALLATAARGAGTSGESVLPDVSAYAQRAPVYEQPSVEQVTGSDQNIPPAGVVRANNQLAVTQTAALTPQETPPTSESADSPLQPPPPSDRRLQLSRSPRSPAGATPPAAGDRTEQMLSGLSENAVTAIGATALVVGLFLVSAWAMKRGMPRSQRILPREVVEVLGRTPLGPRQFAHLLHVGNKIVLVSATPAGAETLVEVSDPQEVDRILGHCKAGDSASSTKEFEAIFQQFAKEPTTKGFLGAESSSYGSSASMAYAQHSRSTPHA